MSQHIYTYDPTNGLQEIGGAGHIIEDAAGVTYAKRENLQFEGASVTDDATNNKTVVTVTETNFVGTMAEWNTLTTAEKAQYKTVDLTDDFNGEPIDDALSTTSEHAVQNKVVTAAINGKAQTDHASSSAAYGLGTTANYGHNKIIDNLSKTSLTSGEALSAHMGNSLGKMVATIESSSTASQAYAVGKQFVYNGILYKATSAISAGGPINPGVGGNCTPADSVTTQISNLVSSYGVVTYDIPSDTDTYNYNYPSGFTGDNCVLVSATCLTRYGTVVHYSYDSMSYWGNVRYNSNNFQYTAKNAGHTAKITFLFKKYS